MTLVLHSGAFLVVERGDRRVTELMKRASGRSPARIEGSSARSGGAAPARLTSDSDDLIALAAAAGIHLELVRV